LSYRVGVKKMRFLTAGESHGPQLAVIIEGYPAGVQVSADAINRDLQRRQRGYGRGGRMKVETDRVTIGAGVRHGKTLGSPILLTVSNRDWVRWEKVMSPETAGGAGENPEILGDDRLDRVAAKVTVPRPGHADLAGVLKYGFADARNILERSSARETAMRVAAGALARLLLKEFGITVGSYVQSIGGIESNALGVPTPEEQAFIEESPLRCLDPDLENRMMVAIDGAKERGDSLGGTFVVYATGVPVGLGSHVHWDRRIDGRLAGAIMSIPAIKGVEFGLGFEAAKRWGSLVHDPIEWTEAGGFRRPTNNAGGVEGGMTNGEPLLIRVAMKPIPTLYSPLPSVDLDTLQATQASVERSDICAVPAAAVVGEAMTAWVLAEALLEKFSGDNLDDLKQAFAAYQQRLQMGDKGA